MHRGPPFAGVRRSGPDPVPASTSISVPAEATPRRVGRSRVGGRRGGLHGPVSAAPGKEVALPPPPPLGTARESFPSCRSSLSNAPRGTRVSQPAEAESTFTIQAWYRHTEAGGRTSRANERLPSFALPPEAVGQVFS